MGTIPKRNAFLPWIAVCATLSLPHASLAQDGVPAAPVPGPGLVQEQLRPQQKWSIRAPELEQITINGMVNFDGAGISTVPMMYPAPNVGGLLAGIITHGIINGAAKRKQKQRLVDAADQVLVPYQSLFATYTARLLLQGSLQRDALRKDDDRIFTMGEPSAADWLIVGEPAFRVSADQRALLIDNAIAVYSPDSRTTPVYRNLVRIVGTPMEGPDEALADAWLKDEGSLFKQTMEELYAESLALAIRSMPSSSAMTGIDANAARTIRYVLGATERMERGQLMFEDCGRVTIRTLYGTIMSVPTLSKGMPVVPLACEVEKNPQDPRPGPEASSAPPQALPRQQAVRPEETPAAAANQ